MDKDTLWWAIQKIARNARLAGEYAEKSTNEDKDSPITITYGHLATKYADEVKTDMAWVKQQLGR